MQMARALHANLGIPADVLLQQPGGELPSALEGIEWQRFPLAAMAKLGWIEKRPNLLSHTEEIMRDLIDRLCRHDLSWASAGVHKAEAVHEALSLIAPAIDVRVRVHRVAGQESALVAAAALKGVLMAEHTGLNEFEVQDITIHRRGAIASFVRCIEEAVSRKSARTRRAYRHDVAHFMKIFKEPVA